MDGRAAGDPSLRRALEELEAALRNVRGLSEELPHRRPRKKQAAQPRCHAA